MDEKRWCELGKHLVEARYTHIFGSYTTKGGIVRRFACRPCTGKRVADYRKRKEATI